MFEKQVVEISFSGWAIYFMSIWVFSLGLMISITVGSGIERATKRIVEAITRRSNTCPHCSLTVSHDCGKGEISMGVRNHF